MPTDLFDNIFNVSNFTIEQFMLCIATAFVCGMVAAAFYIFRSEGHTHSFVTTIAIMPPIVTVVILVVGNNIGAGIAVAGAFSLVKFRSAPGTAKEIVFIFLTMSSGLLVGAGYLGYSIVFTISVGIAYTIYNYIRLSKNGGRRSMRILKITIPEDLNYSGLFDEILKKYSIEYRLSRVKSTNMGSMFRLTYEITMKNPVDEKDMIDEIRCRNGNLEVSISDYQNKYTEL